MDGSSARGSRFSQPLSFHLSVQNHTTSQLTHIKEAWPSAQHLKSVRACWTEGGQAQWQCSPSFLWKGFVMGMRVRSTAVPVLL